MLIEANQKILVFSLIIVLLCCACSAKKPKKHRDLMIENVDQFENVELVEERAELVEIEYPEDQNRSKIEASETEFDLDFDQNVLAWQRLSTFVDLYLNDQPKISSDGNQLTAQSENFSYQINRSFQNSKFHYQVKCTCKTGTQSNPESIINAKNLSRFLKEGVLEVDFLEL